LYIPVRAARAAKKRRTVITQLRIWQVLLVAGIGIWEDTDLIVAKKDFG